MVPSEDRAADAVTTRETAYAVEAMGYLDLVTKEPVPLPWHRTKPVHTDRLCGVIKGRQPLPVFAL